MFENPFEEPIQYLQGVGPERSDLLAKLGVLTIGDALWLLPRDVLNLSNVKNPEDLEEGELQSVRGTVVDIDGRIIRGGRYIASVLIDCGSQYVKGTWFNQKWITQRFFPGQNVVFSGKPKKKSGRWEFSHPHLQFLDDDSDNQIGEVLPKYPLTEGLKMYMIRKIMRNVVEQYAGLIPDHLPEFFREEYQLPLLSDAFRMVHTPTTMAEYEQGKRRLIFDDLFEFQTAIGIRKQFRMKNKSSYMIESSAKIDARIKRLFPFDYTEGQKKAIEEIKKDFLSGFPMHRLLQADVGAGKTVIAIYSLLLAIAAGHQAAFMAPTEVLATQHWELIDRILSHSRVKRVFLTGALTQSQRKDALEKIASGEYQLIIGTQAVIQKDVKFNDLALAVIDEQHKFGVMQRAHLSTLGETAPHILVMTATPIPRSLCLTQFGDLDMTVIRDLPPGRQKVTTSRITGSVEEKKVWNFVREKLRENRQAYIVCPRIEDNTDSDKKIHSVESVFEELSHDKLKGFKLLPVHGQMEKGFKEESMDSFRTGETDVLVSTTVIEVGIDIPNANIMIIYDAHRFGLSQLHQLRGRIGRGKHQGYCFLFSDSDDPESLKRLHAMETSSDGFEISEVDFEIRGPGDVLGTRQHGELPLRVADLSRDQEILEEAREAAFKTIRLGELESDEFAGLKRKVLNRFQKLMELPGSG